jgi:hypothetical protein
MGSPYSHSPEGMESVIKKALITIQICSIPANQIKTNFEKAIPSITSWRNATEIGEAPMAVGINLEDCCGTDRTSCAGDKTARRGRAAAH